MTASGSNGAAQPQVDLSVISGLQNLPPGSEVTLRLYAWNGSNAGATVAVGRLSGNDLVIGGSAVLAGGNTSVQFASTGSTVNEDAGTVDLVLEISDEDATNDTEVDVVLITGAPGRVNSYTTQTVTFLAGSAADEELTITISDNSLCDGNTVIGFELQNISGGNSATIGAIDTYDLTINDNDVCTSVSFDVTSASVSEGVGIYNVAVTIADFSTSVDTDVDVVLVSGDGTRISGFTSAAVNFPANSGATQNVTITVVDNSLCDGDEELTFELQNLSGGQGTPFIGPNVSRTLTITDNDAAVAPVAQAASGVGEEEFTAEWDAVSGATGYFLDVYTFASVPATDLFISEYVEGSSSNKYIEIFNGTGASVDLSDYRLRLYANGVSSPTNDVLLSGTLPDNSTIVYSNGSATIFGGTSVANAAVNFTGDDALALYKISTTSNVDIFGSIGFDPGTAWTGAGGYTTSDRTLVRNASVTGGLTVNPATTFPTLTTEWQLFEQDNVDDLGSHTYDGSGLVFVAGFENFDAGTATSATITGLAPGTTYFYVVRAEVGGGCGLSANSNEIEVTTDAPPVPELLSTEASLAFGFVVENGTSAAQTFDVSGSNLDPTVGDITVEVGAGLEYEVSLDEVVWSADVTIGYTGGVLAATTVYVRFAPTSVGVQTGDITISGGGATDVTVALSGTGSIAQIYWDFATATPTIDLVPGITTSNIAPVNSTGSPTFITSTSASSGYANVSGGNNAGIASVNGAFNSASSSYYTWSHTPASGNAVRITDISFGSRSTGTGPAAYSIRSSADNYTNDIATGMIPTDSDWYLYTHSGLNVVGGVDVPLTFRIYGFDGSGAASGSVVWRIDDLDIRGEAIEPAAAYYSQGNGAVNDAIWSTTAVGTPGPAVWSPSASMIVQEGDTITVNANTNVDDLTTELNSRILVGSERLLSVYGNTVILAQNSIGSGVGEVELLSFDPVTVTISGLVTFNNLTVATSAGTTVTGTLDIRGTLLLADGDFDATNATVRLRSNATRTGHLGPVSATADYIGNLTTQRYIPEGVTNWRLLGSAVAGRTVADWDDDFITAGFPGSNYPTFDQPQGSGILWPSVRFYDESDEGTDLLDGLVGVTSIAQTLTPGQGFAVWCGDALGGTAAFVVDVVGEPTLARTPLSLPVSFTNTSTPAADGWNLVSNPLPSAIDFESLDRGTDLFDGYYIYDPVSGSSANWDAELGISTPAGVLDGVIQSSQAFWLKAGGSDVATSVVEADKVSENTGGVFGGVADGDAGIPLVRLTMAGSTDTWFDQTTIAFVQGTPALDVKDALKLDFAHASAPRIATRTSDGHDLIVNRYGTSTGNIDIPVTVRAPITGTYTITVGIAGMDALTCFTLEDMQTGAVTPVTDGSVLTFDLDATESIVADRFVLRSSTAMPYSASPALCGGTATGQVAVQVSEGPVDLTLMDAFGNAVQEAANVGAGEFIFSGLNAGNYTVSVGNTSACGIVSAPVVVLEPFNLEATIATTESTCGTEADGSVELVVLGGEAPYTYQWSNGSTEEVITGAAGTYTAVVTDATGCVLSVETAIPAGPGPEALFETGAEPVLINQPVLFTNMSSPDATYFWDLGDGTTSTDFDVTHSYELPGVYSVVLSVNDGNCVATFTQEITVQLTTNTSVGTVAPFVLNAWSTGEHLIVEHAFDHGRAVHIEVLDATGRLHMQRQVGGVPARVSIPASTLSTGIWFVRVTSGQVQHSFRVPVLR